MLLTELNNRLETIQVDETQLWELHKLYILLDLEKDDFAKIVDTIGVEKLIEKSERYNRFCEAESELRKKENYIKAKARSKELEKEREELQATIDNFEKDLM